MKKSPKLKNLRQTNGQITDTQPTTLDMIWGDDGLSKYGTLNQSEYENYLNNLNKSDLHSHAAKLNVMPIDNRDRLTKTLIREFVSFANKYKQPKFTPAPMKPISKEVQKILSEGR